jgi:hypothetical protein
MKRKYKNEKVKVGDWVYFKELRFEYDSKCKYKVIVATDDDVIVEVKNNEIDKQYIKGWLTNGRSEQKRYGLPNGIRCWYIRYWTKASGRLEIE